MNLLWILRAWVAMVFILHGTGKIIAPAAFGSKFGFSEQESIVLGLVEIIAALLILTGGVLKDMKFYGWSHFVSWAGCVVLIVDMIAAIYIAHWLEFFYFKNGMEFNLTLIVVLLYIALASLPERRNASSGEGSD